MRISLQESNPQVPNEVYTFTQTGNDFHAKMHIEDELGDRTFLVGAKLDGKPSEQKCADTPCIIKAHWDDHSLVWSIQREMTTQNGKHRMFTERKMQLSEDGKTITSERSLQMDDQPQRHWTETWERQ